MRKRRYIYSSGISSAVVPTSGPHTIYGLLNLVAEGDSITGLSNSYAHISATRLAAYSTFVTTVHNLAIPGATSADLRNRAAAADAAYSAGKTNVFTVLIGTNDFRNGQTYSGVLGNGISGWLADLSAYLDARRLVYDHVIAMTILPWVNFQDSDRATVNAGIRALVGDHATGLIDFAADPVMGADGAYTNATLYVSTDQVHPTDYGFGLLADIYTPYIAAIMGA